MNGSLRPKKTTRAQPNFLARKFWFVLALSEASSSLFLIWESSLPSLVPPLGQSHVWSLLSPQAGQLSEEESLEPPLCPSRRSLDVSARLVTGNHRTPCECEGFGAAEETARPE
jgi:hypothetical protein